MKEDQLVIVKERLNEISDYSLAQFFALALAEMHKRGAPLKNTSVNALWQALKDSDPNRPA